MKLAFLFSGQGAQAVGMGRDLYEHSPAAKAAFAQVDAACGTAISTLCFEGPAASLSETKNAQPCLFATSVAALVACAEVGLVPSAVAGHSIGEYAALVAAGALSVETGAALVQQRGLAMTEAAQSHPGSMAAVLGLDADVVRDACAAITEGVVVVANYNSPGQIVISGQTEALAAVSVVLKEKGAKRVLPLDVSGPFHSPLMASAGDAMRPLLESAEIGDPKLPIVANVTADYETIAAEVRENLALQVAGSVRWIETIERLTADSYTIFLECGPGKVLAGLVKRIAPDAVTYSINDRASLLAAKEALGL